MVIYKKYCVIQFLDKAPRGISDNYVCVHNTWIKTQLPKHMHVLVAYPEEDEESTKTRIESGEPPLDEWGTYMAIVKYESDEFMYCALWRVTRDTELGDHSTPPPIKPESKKVPKIKLNLKSIPPYISTTSKNTSATLQSTEPQKEPHSSHTQNDTFREVQKHSTQTVKSGGSSMQDNNDPNLSTHKPADKSHKKTHRSRSKRSKSFYQAPTNSQHLQPTCGLSQTSPQTNISALPDTSGVKNKQLPVTVGKRNKRYNSLPSFLPIPTTSADQHFHSLNSTHPNNQNQPAINQVNNTSSSEDECTNQTLTLKMSSTSIAPIMQHSYANDSNQIVQQLIKNKILTEVPLTVNSAPIQNITGRNPADSNLITPQNPNDSCNFAQFHQASNIDHVPKAQKIRAQRSTTSAVDSHQRSTHTGIQVRNPYFNSESANQSFQVPDNLQHQQMPPNVLIHTETGKHYYLAQPESGNKNIVQNLYHQPVTGQHFSTTPQISQTIQETPVQIFSATTEINQPLHVTFKQEQLSPTDSPPRKRRSDISNSVGNTQRGPSQPFIMSTNQSSSIVYVDSSDDDMDAEETTGPHVPNPIENSQNNSSSNQRAEEIETENSKTLLEKTITESLDTFKIAMNRLIDEYTKTLKNGIENINARNSLKISTLSNITVSKDVQVKQEIIDLDDDTTDIDSDTDDDGDYEVVKKKLKKKSSLVLPSCYNAKDPFWTLKYTRVARGLVELLPRSRIYIEKVKFQHYKQHTKDSKTLARNLMEEVFRKEALQVCSLNGKKCNNISIEDVRPGLNENAVMVILDFVKMHSKINHWNDFELNSVKSSMRNKLQSIRKKKSVNI